MNLLRKIDWINVFLSFQKVPLTAVKMKHTSWKSQKWPLIRVYQPMSGVKDGKVALALKCVTTTASWMMRICSWTAECDKLNLTLRVVSSRGGDGVTKSGGWHISGGWHFPRGGGGLTSWLVTWLAKWRGGVKQRSLQAWTTVCSNTCAKFCHSCWTESSYLDNQLCGFEVLWSSKQVVERTRHAGYWGGGVW